MSRGVEERIDWFREHKPEKVGQCLNHTWLATDLPSAGCKNANEGWRFVADHGRMKRTGAPPRGAWAWWESDTYGHVALSLGNSLILSTDVNGPATVGVVPLRYIAEQWGHSYVGWSDWYVEQFDVGKGENMQMSDAEYKQLVKDVAAASAQATADKVVERLMAEKIFGQNATKEQQDISFRESQRTQDRAARKTLG